VQRRHQKLLEEAPAPGMTLERRAAMGLAAVNAAKAVGYVGAGTVEFIANQDGSFYFMEMNTRLQVEHPVTEMITGLDLVEWQLRVAGGQPLPLTQEQLEIDGHAIEARVYAEDPDKGFLPSTGRLVHLVPPPESDSVRVDTGVEQGDEITPYYDPMIAKLIVWGADRKQALARMRRALTQYRVVGVSNNINFLSRLVALPSFVNAELDTGLIEREQGLLFPPQDEVPTDVWLVAALAELLHEQREVNSKFAAAADRGSPWRALDGWRLNGRAERKLALRLQEKLQEVVVVVIAGGYQLVLNGRSVRASGTLGRGGAIHAQLDDSRVNAAVVIAGERRHVFYRGHSWPLALVDTLYVGGEGEDVEGGLRAPMPGKVVTLMAEPGAIVEKGAPLLVLEAMKMEHTITAPRKGKVVGFHVAAGDQVADGTELVEFEGAEA
ncbi:MAG TPA: biotin/lipoyl-containing protein, partial [Steroidobacteraceae bacterium]|nr:biotin/lipoyl-containing protein [Steroidobacteraceae bacterium]